ncbi:hypothetical protein [Rhizobium terrae]|uniref:hypothetical protein n=1 Tax=Rhizobium terrae TaxID=2171756 RepID=UPI000E3C1BCA|nr:hypothetical protein [Rhizobium terrae]
MLADAETLRNLCNRIASLRDLAYRLTLKLFAEFDLLMMLFLPSKLRKKPSTNLGAIQIKLRKLHIDWRAEADATIFDRPNGYPAGAWDRTDVSYQRPLTRRS